MSERSTAERRGASWIRGDVAWTTPPAAPARIAMPLAACLAFLVADNLLTNLWLPQAFYVPYRLVSAAVLLLIATRFAGCDAASLGLSRDKVGSGLRWGGACVAIVAGFYLIGTVLPFAHDLYRDKRVQDLSFAGLLYYTLLAVPFGTVVLEEIAFRGVLPAIVNRRTTIWRSVLVASACFGLWHILPAVGLNTTNPAVASIAGGSTGEAVGIAFAIVSTFLVGIVFSWVRYRSGSLLAPILLHISTNSIAYATAYAVVHT